MADDGRLGPLLGRWHQWRRAYSPERGYARPPALLRERDTEEELERLTMLTLEEHIEAMDPRLQLALQHVARAECMGVEVIMSPHLGNRSQRETLVQQALQELKRRLLQSGVL